MNTERTEKFVNALACDLEEGGFRQVSGTTLRRTLATAVSAALPLLEAGNPVSSPAGQGDDLLPCPFCGNNAEFVPYKNNGLTVKCKSMGCIQRHQRTLRYGIEWLRASMTEHWNARALAARPPGAQEPVDEASGKGKRKVKAVVSQDDLHKILYLIHALKNIGNKVWLKQDIHADDYRAATINDAAKVASGAIELLTRAYSALSGARADARVSRSEPGDAWIYADLNELSPLDVSILRDMRDHMAARTMTLNDWHAFGPPVLDRVLALIDNDHAHRDDTQPPQGIDLGASRKQEIFNADLRAILLRISESQPGDSSASLAQDALDLIDQRDAAPGVGNSPTCNGSLQVATLATVKPPRDLRTKVPAVAEIREDV